MCAEDVVCIPIMMSTVREGAYMYHSSVKNVSSYKVNIWHERGTI